jgi:hypothetical protein
MSDSRRSETGLTHPARGMPGNYTSVILDRPAVEATVCRCR